MAKQVPSMDEWLREAKASKAAKDCGMFLVHNGVVRRTPKATVREGAQGLSDVDHIHFSYDSDGVDDAVAEAMNYPGIKYIRTWLNEGDLVVGDDIMYVLVGGDIRPNVIDALQKLVGKIKNELVVEKEVYVD